ncbi:MAG: trypsin-like serine protease [Solirubrobacterales bacterium]
MKNFSRSAAGLFCAGVIAVLVGGPAAGHAASVPGFDSVEYKGTTATADGGPAIQAKGNPSGDELEPRIVGGTETSFESYPWQVQITRQGQSHCGGTLIHPRLVITAAHCLRDQNGFFAGIQAFTGRTFTGTGGEQLNLSNGYVPNSYQPPAFGNDYAFISLTSASSRTQMKIAGPDETALWKAGRVGVATGYGNIVQGGAESPRLREVGMPFIADSVCGGPDIYFTTFQQQVMMCAGDLAGGKSTCQGDSGGPLLARSDNGYRLVGVTSFADGCAKPNRPTVFARVADPALGAIIATSVRNIETGENFPGTDSSVAVIGSGAKPFGCTAAMGAAGAATSAVTAAQSAADTAANSLEAARTQRNKASKQKKGASTQLKKATKVKRKVLKRRNASKLAKKFAVKNFNRAKNKFKQANKNMAKANGNFKSAQASSANAAGALGAAQGNAAAAAAAAGTACN